MNWLERRYDARQASTLRQAGARGALERAGLVVVVLGESKRFAVLAKRR